MYLTNSMLMIVAQRVADFSNTIFVYIYWIQFTDGYVVCPSRSVHINTQTVVMCFELSINDVL